MIHPMYAIHAGDARTRGCEHGRMDLRRWLGGRRSALVQAELDRAVAAVDRELAADIELMTMFGQTKQFAVLELGQFLAHAELLAREVPAAHAEAADLYARVPAVEAAMERRGPANSLRDDDREVI